MTILYYVILVIIGSSVYFITYTIVTLFIRPRLRSVAEVGSSKKRKVLISEIKFLRPLIRLTRPIANLSYMKRLKTQSDILRLQMDLPGVVLLKVFMGFFGGLAVSRLSGNSGYGMMAMMIGFFVPDIMFMNKIRGKKQAIIRVFPETVDLIDLCIGAGLDFTASLRWVIEKTEDNPFIEQLNIVLSEIQVGRNRSDALKDMGKRLQLSDINSFVRTVIQSERMGTSVEEAFSNLSEDTRVTRYQNGERYAIKASMKILFPLLFCILPVIMIIVAGPIIIKFTEGSLIPKTF